ncbi:MAG TPA: SirB2 family protein [Noviherbaspirillum sp.]|nr:SirB2 family protein [Noviherbaspirillum sp.]
MTYYTLKHLHVACALVSGLLFGMRGLWMLQASPLAQRRSLRLAAHVIDTVLLVSAIGLVVWSARYPLLQDWLTVKVIAVFAYIGVGSIALKRGSSRFVRGVAFVTALAIFAYILKLALTKQPF